MVRNVDPNIECLITQDIEMTSDVNHNDIAFAANSWMEFTYPEMTATVSNPWLQIWKGGIRPLIRHPERPRHVRRRGCETGGDDRGQAHDGTSSKFVYQNRVDVYVQRMLDASSTFYGYRRRMLKSEKGWMVMVRTYPRHPSGKRPTNRSHVDAHRTVRELSGRTGSHRVRRKLRRASRRAGRHARTCRTLSITQNPYVRPDDYGIPITAQHHDDKTGAEYQAAMDEIKRHSNPLWEKGYQFYCVTPKTRHRVHSQWSVNDWIQMYESNFGDPYRMDKRTPGVGEHQMHINPKAAKDRGINDGDYIYVDANPVDRPYRGWKPSDPYYKVSRLMIRCQVQPGVSVQRDDGEARAVRGDAEIGEGA